MIFLFEDNPAISEIITDILHSMNIECTSFRKPPDSIDELKKSDKIPNLIIYDLIYHRTINFDFLEKIKKDNIFMNIPVVVITAADEEKTKRAKSIGADEVITKPFKISQIKNVVNRYLQ